ncbi:flavin monoamine oxidase family protein [candidate division CSSED10-310 bacterium]|uniref:Flavin monoamine oxidase family protein n=1 Tax=candidate division CSSED10-310 bacterium TaxID=2855610 RepID=A0ABV6Z6J0_UNCC1
MLNRTGSRNIRDLLRSSPRISRRAFSKLSLATLGSALSGPLASAVASDTGSQDGSDYDLIVIGGGISGLFLAWLQRHRTVIVLERAQQPGGRIISGQWEGFDYAKGMEYIGPPEADVAVWFNALGLSPITVPPPTDAIAYQSQLYHGQNILDFLGSEIDDFWELETLLADYDDQGIPDLVYDEPGNVGQFADLDNQYVTEWLNANGFGPILQQYIDIENRGLFGSNNNDLSFFYNIAEWVYNLPDPDEQNISDVYTFPRGMIEVVETLMGVLSTRVQKGAQVTSVEVDNDDMVTVNYNQHGQDKTVKGRAAVLTTPAPITASIVVNGLHQTVIQALQSVFYSSYVTLNLFTSERLLSDYWAIASLDDYFVSVYDSIRTQVPLDYTGKSILGVYLVPQFASDPTLFLTPDAQILEQSLVSLEKYYPTIRQKVLGHDIHRFGHAYPVFGKNYHTILGTLHNHPSVWGPLFLAGDYMVYPTFEEALKAMGYIN